MRNDALATNPNISLSTKNSIKASSIKAIQMTTTKMKTENIIDIVT